MKEKKERRTFIGGQALMEGVMMQGATSMAMTVRTEDGDILTETARLKPRRWYSRVPVIRGVVSFVRSLISGVSTTIRSSEVIYPEEETPSKGMYAVATLLGVLLAVGLFILLPTFITWLISLAVDLGVLLSSLIEGVVRILLFLAYLFLISRMKDIRRTFMYHGAEHRTINCFESGKELTVENVQTCSTRHNRCGTTFLFFVMIVSILVFSLASWILDICGLGTLNVAAKMGLRLLLLPIVAGLSFELLRFLAVLPDNKIVGIFRAPGLALQRLTTYPPEPDMAEVAIISFNLVREMDADQSILPHKFGEFSYQELKKLVSDRLSRHGITEAAESDWIIAAALGKKRSELAQMEKTDFAAYRKVAALCRERESGKPLDYILGKSEFYGLDVTITQDVLVPRLDTELLADEAIKYIGEKPLSVLDLCTGSGCIALAICEKTSAVVTATDISDKALAVARTNLGENAEVIKSDMFSELGGKTFDVIVSNPPYIKTDVIATLSPDVKCQPLVALDGGSDGLDFYRVIAKNAPLHLSDDGAVFLEIGYDQREAVTALMSETFSSVECIRDYDGNDRIIIAKDKKQKTIS